ncbi:MAG TPA: septation protein SepH [Spirillospora sp.]
MQELRLVAVSEDGTYLVLATAGRGTRFTLPVDDRLRAAVRGHFSRLGQFEIEVESPLRPKEIQARIRSGETAEEIAESAGIPVERVRWFEGPVLQEREYMAQQAQRVTIRRPGESTPGPPLGETVEERLSRGGVDLEEAEWDSWKCEDGTWRVRLSFFDNGRPHAAEWTFDPRRRYVYPLDETAARLTSLDWEDEDDAFSDTVTPLVPRRPAMKVVSNDRDPAALGLSGEPVPPGAPGRLRPAEYGRPTGHRPTFREPGEAPSLRKTAQEPSGTGPEQGAAETGGFQARQGGDAGRDKPGGETAADRGATEAAGSAGRATETGRTAVPGDRDTDDARGNAERHATAAPEPREDEARTSEPAPAAQSDDTGGAEPAAEPAAETAAGDGGTADTAKAAADEPRAGDAGAGETGTAKASTDEAGAAKADAEDGATAEKPEPAAAHEPGTQQEAGASRPDGDKGSGDVSEHRAPAAGTGETGARPAAADTPARSRFADTPGRRAARARAAEAERERRAESAGGTHEPADARRGGTRPAEESRPAAQQPAQRPARTPAKKKPATRPTMPAAQDKPATGSPAAAAGAEPAAQRPARRRKSKGKRASVPSWDEIMFGARRPD